MRKSSSATSSIVVVTLLLVAVVTLHDAGVLAQSVPDAWEAPSNLMPNPTIVKHTTAMTALCPPRNVDVLPGQRPIPTNTWWGNLITCDAEANATRPASNVTGPIWPNPFAINVEMVAPTTGLYGFALAYPYRMRFFGNAQANGVPQFYGHPFLKEVVFSAAEFATTTPVFRVASWSDLGVKLQMKLSSTQTLESDVVNGMAYFTTTYRNLTPRLALNDPIATINSASYATGTIFTGRRFLITTVNGNAWLLYAVNGATLTFKLDNYMQLRSTAAFSGTLRLAYSLSATHTSVYDFYRECVVTGGTTNLTSTTNYSFEWHTSGNCAAGLVNFALPHQRATIDVASAARIANFSLHSATRGEMAGFVTRTSALVWRLLEPAAMPIAYYPKTRMTAANVSNLLGSAFVQTLISDIQATWSISTMGSFYFNGKAAQKYASLCLMANDRALVGDDVSILQRCVTKLETSIVPFLTNEWFYKLQYDAVYGGIVTSEGFITSNINADFGNTVYNDHHYHYGYWIYAAAVINFLHPTWSRLDELNTMTRLLLRDVATPNSNDPFFPKYRNFDWFRGHSYSHGVTTFGDGKDEESTSEDVNFAYALYLYGLATNHARMATVGKLMMKLNARATQTYFLMEASNTIHPPRYIPNKVPGIYFDNKLDYATWFSGEKFCIHGIQMIPITPVTEFTRSKTFVREEWDVVLSKDAIVTTLDISNPWLSLLYANYARIDRTRALQVLRTCQVDDGLTRSWAMYMAAQLN